MLLKPRIADGYIIREITPTFLIAVMILTFTLILNRIILIAENVITKGISLTLTLKLLSYYIPSIIVLTIPMAILVNRYSASASEIVSACLQDHGRAIIVGERTWGKGSVQNIVELEDGASALKLTTAGYLRPSGDNIHRFNDSDEDDDWGVTPNEGFELKLPGPEMRQVHIQRREKDIIRKENGKPDDSNSEESGFVDRQLQKGLEYLYKQLEIAKEEEPETKPKPETKPDTEPKPKPKTPAKKAG